MTPAAAACFARPALGSGGVCGSRSSARSFSPPMASPRGSPRGARRWRSVVFGWEHAIPFVPWTIVPYWTIDLLYGLSLFVCVDRRELDTHAKRLLTAQVVAIASFLLFPLRFTFERPETGGVFGDLFRVLAAFDQPFNQAPSLHIALLVILWALFARRLHGVGRIVFHAWFALIGVSVLTTWQHHFIDLPTGALARVSSVSGCGRRDSRRRSSSRSGRATATPRPCLAICDRRARSRGVGDRQRRRGAVGPLDHGGAGSGGAQLRMARPGRIPEARRPPFASRVGCSWRRTSRAPSSMPGHGRARVRRSIPSPTMSGSGECRRPQNSSAADSKVSSTSPAKCRSIRAGAPTPIFPVLDLTLPDRAALGAAVEAIERLRPRGRVLVCCALGVSRSAVAVAAWLVATGRAPDADAALARVRAARPQIVLGDAHRARVAAMAPRPAAA